MAITHSPKVGEILECNYGDYLKAANGQTITNDYNGHVPPEMVKNRLVVVLNGKLNGNACIVVPLSSTSDPHKTQRGLHVEIAHDLIEDLQFFGQTTRWAKADLIQQVSSLRLNRPRLASRGFLNQHLPRDVVTQIQTAVIKCINAASLVPSVLQPQATAA